MPSGATHEERTGGGGRCGLSETLGIQTACDVQGMSLQHVM